VVSPLLGRTISLPVEGGHAHGSVQAYLLRRRGGRRGRGLGGPTEADELDAVGPFHRTMQHRVQQAQQLWIIHAAFELTVGRWGEHAHGGILPGRGHQVVQVLGHCT
jgi:hypothetical protein